MKVAGTVSYSLSAFWLLARVEIGRVTMMTSVEEHLLEEPGEKKTCLVSLIGSMDR